MGKAKVSSNFFLVLLCVSLILPGEIESVFDRIIEVMHEEMANVIHFAKQPSPWHFTLNLRYVQFSCIAGFAAPINVIEKQSFWHTLMETLFHVDL